MIPCSRYETVAANWLPIPVAFIDWFTRIWVEFTGKPLVRVLTNSTEIDYL